MNEEMRVDLSELFKPFSIGRMRLKNRIVLPAIATSFPDDYGRVTERLKAYYEERVKGGVGLIISEMAPVDIAGRTRYQSLMIHKDEFIPGLRELVEIAHRHDTRLAIQLCHAGRYGAIAATHKLSQSASGRGGCVGVRRSTGAGSATDRGGNCDWLNPGSRRVDRRCCGRVCAGVKGKQGGSLWSCGKEHVAGRTRR